MSSTCLDSGEKGNRSVQCAIDDAGKGDEASSLRTSQ